MCSAEMFPEAKTPADVTPAMANEYKRRRAEAKVSPWTVKGTLAILKAVFGKWLGRECGLLTSNPFANVKPPKCDDPEVRIVTAAESEGLVQVVWRTLEQLAAAPCLLGSGGSLGLAGNGNGQPPGGRLACRWIRAGGCRELQDPAAQVRLASSLTCTPICKACAAGGWAFGRFSDELRRLLILWKTATPPCKRWSRTSPPSGLCDGFKTS